MGTRLRVVLDTNNLISALGWKGNEAKILELCLQGKIELCLSAPILNELNRVLQYPKFGFREQEKRSFLRLLKKLGIWVRPTKRVTIITEDEADNKFLECALKAKADFIVSGDKHLLRLRLFKDIPIVTAKELLKLLSK